jgi:competence protein ComEA
VACAIVAFTLAASGGSGGVVVEGDGGLILASVDPSSGDVGLPGSGEIVVEVVGAVPRPGVFRLPAGSRIGDLIAAAGGYGPRVDTARAEAELNLAATLGDGDHIRVPSRDDPTVAVAPSPGAGGEDPSGDGGGGPLDLNTATQAELEELPGVGPATAQKIMTAREEAPFTSVDELRSRGVLGEKTFEKVRDLVAVP